MKKGLARISVFMMAAAIAASVAACTPQDKKGGAKSQAETTVQAKVSKEKAKKEKTKKREKKKGENAKVEMPTKTVEVPAKATEGPKQEAKGPGAGPAKGPGIQETAPKAPAGNGAVKPSVEPSKGQAGEKAPKASEGVKEQDTKKDEKKKEKRNLHVILGSIVIGEASYRIASLPRIRDCYSRIVSPFVFRQNNTFHEQMDTITRKARFLQPYCTSYMV